MLKHFVEFMCSSGIVTSKYEQMIESRNPEELKIPEHIIAFRFFDKRVVYEGDERLEGKPQNYSGWYYLGKKMSYADLENLLPEEGEVSHILISMREKNCDYVVKTAHNNFFLLGPIDTVVVK